MKSICILGSTGSIGTQALEVCEALGYKVSALSANSNIELLRSQAEKFRPKRICVFDSSYEEELKSLVSHMDIEVLSGMEGLCELARTPCDILLNSVVGMVGLKPTLVAIEEKRMIALANKETLVTGGELVMEAARKNGVFILPVDSEHSAIFQALEGRSGNKINKIILTASGGPFWGKTKKELEAVTVEQALKHPNWDMGAKITIDSATMMNKGLELIEACRLFDVAPKDVEIVVHRESVVHSLVEYEDGAVIGQLGTPDMKIPIQYALTYPKREKCDTKRLSLTDYGSLSFHKPDFEVFECLGACIEACNRGGVYPTIVNGANEEAVSLFLKGKIGFLDIGRLVYGSLSLKYDCAELDLNEIDIADRLARDYVNAMTVR